MESLFVQSNLCDDELQSARKHDVFALSQPYPTDETTDVVCTNDRLRLRDSLFGFRFY